MLISQRLKFLAVALVFIASAAPSFAKDLPKKHTPKKVSAVSDADLGLLKKLDGVYQKQSISMDVEKVTKLAVLEQVRKASGKLWISAGKIRMDLQGADHTMLVINKQKMWVVVYPAAEFKDAAIQVSESSTLSKLGRSQGIVTLLTRGGFLKFFTATGAVKDDKGDVKFFLSPKEDQPDFKRVQIQVSADGKRMDSISYWDSIDNETHMEFTNIKNEPKLSNDLFDYVPPKNADVSHM